MLCEMNYVDGEANGAAREFYPDGRLETLSWITNGNLPLLFKYWSHKTAL